MKLKSTHREKVGINRNSPDEPLERCKRYHSAGFGEAMGGRHSFLGGPATSTVQNDLPRTFDPSI